MCNATEMEIPVTGDVDTSMLVETDLKEIAGKDIAAIRHRPSQPLKDFFVPVSQREKAPKKLVDEAAKPNPGIVEDVAKNKRGRPRKNSLEDNSKEFFIPLSSKDRPKKLSSIDASGALNLATVSVAEDGAGEEAILNKKRPQKTSSINALVEPSSAALIIAQDGAEKGESPSSKLTEENGSDFFVPVSKRERVDKELFKGEATALVKIASIGFENGAKKRGRPRKLSLEVDGNSSKAPRIQKDGQADKLSIEGLPAATRLHPFLAKDKKSVVNGFSHKDNASAIPDSTVLRSEHDLRLEAVVAAQENARLNAGKATHPFFARKKVPSLKTCLRWEEASAFQTEDLQPGPPLHVTQLSEDERIEVVLPAWKLRSPSVSEDTKVEFCKLGPKRCRLVQHVLPIWAELDGRRVDGHLIPTNVSELVTSRTVYVEEGDSAGNESTSSTSSLKDLHFFLQHLQTVKSTVEPVEEQAKSPETCQRIDAHFTFENLKDKLAWYIARHNLLKTSDNLPMFQISKESEEEALPSTRNLLWTDLYQPRSSKEVCGNTAAVDALNSWLYNWQIKISGQNNKGEDVNKCIKADKAAGYDSDNGWSEVDSDVDRDDDVDDDTGLQNTLLVTGPEGCGKSAAVYACAGEQGFTVIEVNASDCRNGALIKQKFGEAMESHGLGKGSQLGVESPQAASKGAHDTQESISSQSRQNSTNQKRLFVEKRLVERSPKKSQQVLLMASEDENQVDTQSKRKTVILFEDVDKHFDEDKGFLTTLVQLSKTTKRPIIFTSNRYEPGLPPALEKCKVNFGYPTSEELVLHAGLVSIAEGFPCSPCLLERLVDSCHNDLRKVMMALQFWGQGKHSSQKLAILSRPAGIPQDIEDPQLATDGATNNLNRSSRMSLSCKQNKGPFQHWESAARWLFELDVHHFILPKVIDGSFLCPLTLVVGEKISAAVQKLEEHLGQVAASESEERGRARQAESEILDLARKALKKEKDAIRRASQLYSKFVDDGVISHTPDEDVAPDNRCDESWTPSPMKSLREAKNLARSPLKPKILKSRRVLVLCDSDDEEQRLPTRPEESIQISNRSISDVETPVTAAPILLEESIRISNPGISDVETPVTAAPIPLEESILINNQGISDVEIHVPGAPIPLEESTQVNNQGISDVEIHVPGATMPLEESIQISNQDISDIETHVPGAPIPLEESIQISNQGISDIETHVPGAPIPLEESIQISNQGISDVEIHAPAVQVGVATSEDCSADVVVDNLEDTDVTPSSVSEAWANLRNSEQTPKLLLNHGDQSADVTSLSELLGIISDSDVISCVEPEEYKDAWRDFDGVFSEAFEGNIGHCSDWESCQEIASQLVCAGLQLSLHFLSAVNHIDYRLPALSCILESAKDPPAVGKCMVAHVGLTRDSLQYSELCGMVDNLSAKMSPLRQADREGKLEDIVQAAVFPRGRVSRSGFVEYSTYLSRMSQLEETRRAKGLTQGRRPRRFEHQVTSKLKSVSDSDITELLKYSNFKSN